MEFNLETIGWLSGGRSEEEQGAVAELVSFLLMFIAKYRWAANLHLDVTAASYDELQQKNEALQASEARYRQLSDELQCKVDEQVRVVQRTQQELYESAHMRSVGQLAAGVAHEINNPVGFIRSNLGVARDYVDVLEGSLPEGHGKHGLLADFRDLLAESMDGTRRIAGIVADLKTFSSIDQHEFTRCRINELLLSAVNLVQAEYGHQLNVTDRLDDQSVVNGSPSRLAQAFFNLLENAAQALDAAGTGQGGGRYCCAPR
ncbi:sensor histidine kinase [Marinobacter sp. X15-166B]|uniref:sensor histidine kinase n=1 Tax=Marinobacter sp. X15-166B TaxID=1897620 RepID=UPI0018E98D75|nr:histidine kinase dimerization/phospho-acceptor domain-containing protein [Marinobacter sp. X15-166B]